MRFYIEFSVVPAAVEMWFLFVVVVLVPENEWAYV